MQGQGGQQQRQGVGTGRRNTNSLQLSHPPPVSGILMSPSSVLTVHGDDGDGDGDDDDQPT